MKTYPLFKLITALRIIILLLFVSGVVNTNILHSQTVTEEWVQRFNGVDSLRDLIIDMDVHGHVFVTGTMRKSSTDIDYVILKYDSTGNLIWSNTYDGPFQRNDIPSAIVADDQCNVYVTGSSRRTNTLYDWATLAYDASGNLLWEHRYPANPGTPSGILRDAAGNIYIAGSDFGGANYDYVLIKYDTQGNLLWNRTYNHPSEGNDFTAALAADTAGNILITGYTSFTSGDPSHYTTVKYDAQGNLVWSAAHTSGDNRATAIALDISGNSWVTGSSQDVSGKRGIETVAYDPTGNVIWTRRYEGSGAADDSPNSIAVSGDKITLAGNVHNVTTLYDYVVLQYNVAGDLLWSAFYNGALNGNDIARKVIAEPDGSVYVTGGIAVKLTPVPVGDIVTIKYDNTGTELWKASYNGPADDNDLGWDCGLDASGNLYVGGYSMGVNTEFDIVTIKYAQTPCSLTADAGADVFTLPGQSVQIGSAPITGLTYSWLPTTGLDNPTISNPAASPDQTTVYVLTAHDSTGCTANDTVTVTVMQPAALRIPDFSLMMHAPNANFRTIRDSIDRFYKLNAYAIDTIEGNSTNSYKRWRTFWTDRVGTSGNNPGNFSDYINAINGMADVDLCTEDTPYEADWKLLGPMEAPLHTMGAVFSVARHPKDINTVFAGSHSGGLWKTTNANDPKPLWQNITDAIRIATVGVSAIVINPDNPQTIYIGTTNDRGGHSTGVWKTTNGGTSWQRTGLTLAALHSTPVQKLIIHPQNTNILYALVLTFAGNNISKSEVRKTIDAGVSWNTIYEVNNLKLENLVFNAANPDILYASGQEQIIRITSSGYSDLSTLPSFTIPPTACCVVSKEIRISSPANNLFALVKFSYYSPDSADVDNDSDKTECIIACETEHRIMQYSETTGTWGNITTPNDFGNIFVVSPADSSVMYIGYNQGSNDIATCCRIVKSINGGQSFFKISEYEPTDLYNGTSTHADIRAIQLVSSSVGGLSDSLVVGTDGGILFSASATPSGSTHTVNWKDLNGYGLAITEFHGIGGTEQNANILLGGTQDNGFVSKNENGWFTHVVGDGYDCVVNQLNPLDGHGQLNFPSMSRTFNAGGNWNPAFPDPPTFSGFTDNDWWKFGFRPVLRNSNNVLLTGHHEVYRHTLPSNTWIPISNFAAQGVDTGSVLRTLTASESDPNIMYASFPKKCWDQCGTVKAEYLFKTTNAMDTTPLWTDISASLPDVIINSVDITSIAIHPNHPDTLWATVSGVIPFTTTQEGYTGAQRVIRSTDGGETWHDFSNGLTQFPVHKIVYQKGGNDGLYIATDIGVFYTDNTLYPQQGWQCFSKNMPLTLVYDLEINHCSGKLRAATFGRGIWESPLIPSSSEEEITTTQTWTTEKTVVTHLRIKTGVTLTVNSTVNMAHGKSIIVEPGAKLILDGGKLTNGCGDTWDGVQVWGISTQPQGSAINSPQGILLMRNQAVIEYAREGVQLWKPNDFNSMGGIVLASHSSFRNNSRDVAFMSYQNKNSNGDIIDNISRFSSCTFTSDEPLRSGFSSKPHVTLWDVKGVTFLGNTFANTVTPTDPKGTGIYSIDASYRVLGLQNTFTNLHYGIEIKDIAKAPVVEIKNCRFDNVNRAVWLANTRNTIVTNNTFKLTENAFNPTYGVYIDGSSQFKVEDNSFESLTPQQGFSYGMAVNNSGESKNELYKNNFNNLFAGIQMQGISSLNSNEGLQLKCNTLTGSTWFAEMAVTSGKLPDQGFCPQNSNDQNASKSPAGNTFSHACNLPVSDFFTASGIPSFKYSHHTDAPRTPLCYSPTIKLDRCIGFDFSADACPTHPESTGSGIIIDGIGVLTELINEKKLKVDGGNTQGLLQTIVTQPDGNLKNTLLAVGPYLSDTVLIAYSRTPTKGKNGVSPGNYKQVIIANSPVTEPVQTALDARDLPNGIRKQIEAAQIGESPRAALESELFHFETQRELATHELERFYLTDTLIENGIDSAIALLLTNPSPSAKEGLMGLYLQKQDTASARNILVSLQYVPGYETYVNLHTLLLDLDTTVFDLKQDTVKQQQVTSMAADTTQRGYLTARAVTTLLNDIRYGELIEPLPQAPVFRLEQPRQDTKKSKEKDAFTKKEYMKLYPNPAGNTVILDYVLTETPISGSLSLYSITGTEVLKAPITELKGKRQIDIATLTGGVYFYLITVNATSIARDKLIIIK